MPNILEDFESENLLHEAERYAVIIGNMITLLDKLDVRKPRGVEDFQPIEKFDYEEVKKQLLLWKHELERFVKKGIVVEVPGKLDTRAGKEEKDEG